MVTEIDRSTTWQKMLEVNDTRLKQLAKLTPSLVLASRSHSTVQNYFTTFKRFQKWVKQFPELSALPANPTSVAMYLLAQFQMGKSQSVMKSDKVAISWMHINTGYDDPTQNSLLNILIDGAKRLNSRALIKKDPITVEILIMLKKVCTPESGTINLLNLRTIVFSILSFTGFMRFNEVSNLRRCDLNFYDTHMSVFIEKSKTDQLREGRTLVIAKIDSDLCPVENTKVYLSRSEINCDSDEFIFRNMQFYKSSDTYRLRPENKPLSYSNCRDILKKKLKQIGVDCTKFGLHSFRAGGASAAANANVNDRMFKRHGRWVSENAKDGYVSDSLEKRLSVTLNLGL